MNVNAITTSFFRRAEPLRAAWLCGVAFLILSGTTPLLAADGVDLAKLPPAAQRAVDFDRDVRPIFQASCHECHGPDTQKNGLRLDARAAALAGSDYGKVIIPGDSAASRLVHYVSGAHEKFIMPPKGERLSAEQVGVLRAWIDQGAIWPDDGIKLKDKADHWAFKPAGKPAVPKLSAKAAKWARTPIDAFILAKLREKNLSPSPRADRRTLIRRVYYDLTGLPPTPEEVDAFVADADPQAYEKLVDRLLASPRYGERWARHWLDVVHYGDTHGYDKDKLRPNAWPYRDYVIQSLNADKPYSRFVQEQIAGDVLFPNDPKATVATGFITAGPWDFVGHIELREGTVDKEITRSNDRDDMVMTAMSTFQSLTVHCARCHDHKFDPIKQEDYYRLQAVFAGIDRGDRPYNDVDAKNLAARNALAARRAELEAKLKAFQETAAKVTTPAIAAIDEELAALRPRVAALPQPGSPGHPSLGYHSEIMPSQDLTKWVQVDLGEVRQIDQIILIPAHVAYGGWPGAGFGFPVRFRVDVSDDPEFEQFKTLSDQTAADVVNPGNTPFGIAVPGTKARYVRVTATKLFLRTNDWIFALGEMLVFSGSENIAAGKAVTSLDSIEAPPGWARAHLVDGVSVFGGGDTPAAADWVKALANNAERLRLQELEAQRAALVDAALDAPTREGLATIPTQLADLEQQINTISQPKMFYGPVPLAQARPIHLLKRGDVKAPDKLVQPGVLSVFEKEQPDFVLAENEPEGARRARLAKWITDPSNLLTRRSIVNRVWHYHFGRGIVDSPNDFGHMGEEPTHPELLDWLAYWFQENGESLKALHRLILTSSTYRQTSASDPEKAKIDGANQFLWRMNRQRLDAESVRDTVLQVAGKLDLSTMGGPGFMEFGLLDDHSPHYKYHEHDPDDPKSHRRSIYRFIVRSVPDPFMETLDCADPSSIVERRNETLTALQALALLNNKFMVRMSEHFAARAQGMGQSLPEQVNAAYRLAIGRAATPEELAVLTEVAQKHGLPNACRLILNTNEFVFVD